MSGIVSTHVARTIDDWPNMVGVPTVICKLSRAMGAGPYAELMPFVYGVAHTLSTNEMNMETLAHAVLAGIQGHYICQTVGLH